MQAGEFAEIFKGFSIGSKDPAQLTLVLDRNAEIISELFNEKNKAVKDCQRHKKCKIMRAQNWFMCAGTRRFP